MPAERIAMRQVREVVRLKAAGISTREIAVRLSVAPSPVRLTLQRLASAGLGFPLPEDGAWLSSSLARCAKSFD